MGARGANGDVAAGLQVEVKSVTLEAVDRVRVRFAGPPRGLLLLTYRTTEQGTPGPQGSCVVDLSAGEAVSRETSIVTTEFAPPLLQPCDVEYRVVVPLTTATPCLA